MAAASALKTVTDLDDCADLYMTLLESRSITGQCFVIDAGLSYPQNETAFTVQKVQ